MNGDFGFLIKFSKDLHCGSLTFAEPVVESFQVFLHFRRRQSDLFSVEHWAQDFRNTDVTASRGALARRRTGRCRGCKLSPSCEGLWSAYLRRYGDAELKAVK